VECFTIVLVNLQKNKVLLSWSTGKDSAYALYQMRNTNNFDVVGLLTTITEEYDRVSMHSTRHDLLKKQAEQLNLPLFPVFIPASCTHDIYKARMQIFIEQAAQQGITHIVFGDLFLENVRKYRESQLASSKIRPLFPLWGKNTKALAHEIIQCGWKAIITCVDSQKLDACFTGRHFDQEFLNDIPKDVDPCGENGEFHTFVYDGPLFQHPIPTSLGEIMESNGCFFRDILHNDKV
jgi:uncharacterized protein (TIGR00290 family)